MAPTEGENSTRGAQTCSQLRAALETLMTIKKAKDTASYAGAMLICQNLGELTAYQLAGDQILIPDDDGDPAQSLILMPGARLASDEMVRAVAKLGMTALGVRCILGPDDERIPDFTVLYAEKGKAERFGSMRPWMDREGGLCLIPDEGTAGETICFRFDRGLRMAARPWSDEADRRRGIAEAKALLLADGADSPPG